MDEFILTGVFLAALFFLLGSGVWIGLSLIGVALTGMWLFTVRPAGDAMVTTIWTGSSSWTLTALPLFIWMGEILFRTRLSEDMFKGLSPWMSHLPGRLLHFNVVGCAIFAAISGSSAATVATVGKMSIPELRRQGYPEKMTIGTLAGAGTLGLLIPPSIILIVYGVTINESISKLFIAGIAPGLMLAVLFMGYTAVWSGFNRDAIPPARETLNFIEKIHRSIYLIPIMALIMTVLGSIYLGWFTATEAAVLGVVGALTLSAIQGSLTRDSFSESLMGATRTSCMIALILAGSTFLSLSMGFTGLPRSMAAWIASLQLTPLTLIAALAVFYIVLGMFLDGISSVVLTMAVVEPMVRQAGIDMIWFGVFIVIVVETAQITPPIGFNLFVLQGMTRHSIMYVARAAMPLFFLMVLALVAIVAFPEIVTYLPEQMRSQPGG